MLFTGREVRIWQNCTGQGPYSRQRAEFFPLHPHLGRRITFLFFRQKTRPRSYNRSRNKFARGSWTRWKNSVHCRNQSDCMIYRVQPARTLRKKKKRIVIRLLTGKETNACSQHLQNQRRDLPMSTSLCL